jgi:hypothetical protein
MNAPPEEKVYVGSTTKQYLSQRMNAHRSAYKKWKSGKQNTSIYKSYDLFDLYGVENCTIILLETVCCNSKEELYAREAFYIKNLNTINTVVPLRTEAEYYIANKEKIIKRGKEYRELNKDKVNLSYKAYHETHKTERNQKCKEYYAKNCNKGTENYLCGCGSDIKVREKGPHEKTKKHLTYLNSLVENI